MQKISTFTLFISKTNLFWNLTKIIDEADGGVFLEGVVNAVDVDISLVEQMMEHINWFHGRRPLLFVSKNQIYPLVQVCTDKITLHSLKHRSYLSILTFTVIAN